ncbi:MAG: NAD(+)--rifampin ADP-ribosyltransferase [Polyangiaceae bacterium]|nr:NAD(+)--rifampin ADP-ribosyltransferase [Polyangiaceae bacterium]
MSNNQDDGFFFHGTKAVLKEGDFLRAGFQSNYSEQLKSQYVYFTATLDAAIWGAELALGEGVGKIYCVKPTGVFEDDPNLTDKKFPGNPTRSYRTREPLLIVGEVFDWKGHNTEELFNMRSNLENIRNRGISIIIE